MVIQLIKEQATPAASTLIRSTPAAKRTLGYDSFQLSFETVNLTKNGYIYKSKVQKKTVNYFKTVMKSDHPTRKETNYFRNHFCLQCISYKKII